MTLPTSLATGSQNYLFIGLIFVFIILKIHLRKTGSVMEQKKAIVTLSQIVYLRFARYKLRDIISELRVHIGHISQFRVYIWEILET